MKNPSIQIQQSSVLCHVVNISCRRCEAGHMLTCGLHSECSADVIGIQTAVLFPAIWIDGVCQNDSSYTTLCFASINSDQSETITTHSYK